MYRRVIHETLKVNDDYLDNETRALLRGVSNLHLACLVEPNVRCLATAKRPRVQDDHGQSEEVQVFRSDRLGIRTLQAVHSTVHPSLELDGPCGYTKLR